MKIRRTFIIVLFLVLFLSVLLPKLEFDHVWQQTVLAQSSLQSFPIAFAGGSPGCTVLVPAVSGKQVWINNGILVLPAFGTGLAVQFLASTDSGATQTACAASGVTRTPVSGFYVGSQAGTTTTNPTIIPLNGNPAIITPSGQGLIATVTAGTGAQAVGGHFTFTQQ